MARRRSHEVASGARARAPARPTEGTRGALAEARSGDEPGVRCAVEGYRAPDLPARSGRAHARRHRCPSTRATGQTAIERPLGSRSSRERRTCRRGSSGGYVAPDVSEEGLSEGYPPRDGSATSPAGSAMGRRRPSRLGDFRIQNARLPMQADGVDEASARRNGDPTSGSGPEELGAREPRGGLVYARVQTGAKGRPGSNFRSACEASVHPLHRRGKEPEVRRRLVDGRADREGSAPRARRRGIRA